MDHLVEPELRSGSFAPLCNSGATRIIGAARMQTLSPLLRRLQALPCTRLQVLRMVNLISPDGSGILPHMSRIGIVVATAVFLIAASLGRAVPISYPSDKISIEVPDEFAEIPVDKDVNPNLLHAFVLHDPKGEGRDFFLNIEAAGTNLPDGTWQEIMTPDQETSIAYTEKWKDLDLGVYLAQAEGDTNRLVHTVYIPLKPDRLKISLRNDASQEAQAVLMLKSVIASMNAPKVKPEPIVDFEPRSEVPWLKALWYLLLATALILIGVKSVSGR
jgi:hypothetical protein